MGHSSGDLMDATVTTNGAVLACPSVSSQYYRLRNRVRFPATFSVRQASHC